jgi:hypothetical protein
MEIREGRVREGLLSKYNDNQRSLVLVVSNPRNFRRLTSSCEGTPVKKGRGRDIISGTEEGGSAWGGENQAHRMDSAQSGQRGSMKQPGRVSRCDDPRMSSGRLALLIKNAKCTLDECSLGATKKPDMHVVVTRTRAIGCHQCSVSSKEKARHAMSRRALASLPAVLML